MTYQDILDGTIKQNSVVMIKNDIQGQIIGACEEHAVIQVPNEEYSRKVPWHDLEEGNDLLFLIRLMVK